MVDAAVGGVHRRSRARWRVQGVGRGEPAVIKPFCYSRRSRGRCRPQSRMHADHRRPRGHRARQTNPGCSMRGPVRLTSASRAKRAPGTSPAPSARRLQKISLTENSNRAMTWPLVLLRLEPMDRRRSAFIAAAVMRRPTPSPPCPQSDLSPRFTSDRGRRGAPIPLALRRRGLNRNSIGVAASAVSARGLAFHSIAIELCRGVAHFAELDFAVMRFRQLAHDLNELRPLVRRERHRAVVLQ